MKNGCNLVKEWHTHIFSIIDPQIGCCHHFEVLHCNYNGAIGSKMRFGHNFWLEGPIDLRPTRLNCILQDLFRDTPLDHIARAQICTQICQIWPNMPNMHIWVHIKKRRELFIPGPVLSFRVLSFSTLLIIWATRQGKWSCCKCLHFFDVTNHNQNGFTFSERDPGK